MRSSRADNSDLCRRPATGEHTMRNAQEVDEIIR